MIEVRSFNNFIQIVFLKNSEDFSLPKRLTSRQSSRRPGLKEVDKRFN